jgi:hypothetical protein
LRRTGYAVCLELDRICLQIKISEAAERAA